MTNNEIIIKNDEIYSLIQGLKEYRNRLKKSGFNEGANILRKHDTKIEFLLLDRILKNGGLTGMFKRLDYLNEKLTLIELVKAEEEKNGTNNTMVG